MMQLRGLIVAETMSLSLKMAKYCNLIACCSFFSEVVAVILASHSQIPGLNLQVYFTELLSLMKDFRYNAPRREVGLVWNVIPLIKLFRLRTYCDIGLVTAHIDRTTPVVYLVEEDFYS
jgi:hypothetical protein